MDFGVSHKALIDVLGSHFVTVKPVKTVASASLYSQIIECVIVCSLAVANLSDQIDDDDAFESLYGVRNVILMWISSICEIVDDEDEFSCQYLGAWDRIASLLRSLLKSNRVSLMDLYSTVGLFMCFSLIGAKEIPSNWKISSRTGVVVIEDETRVFEVPSMLALPRVQANYLSPRLTNLCSLLKFIVHGSLQVETAGSVAVLLGQLALLFDDNNGSSSDTAVVTLSAEWVCHVRVVSLGVIYS